jgi:hypothetical protein
MLRNRTRRFVATLLACAILLTGIGLSIPALAQDTGGTPEAAPPAASPVASPVPSGPYTTSEFVSGLWRIGVVTAKRANEFPQYELAARQGKDWIIVIADITNWSRDDSGLNPRDFALKLPGGEEPRGFARRSSESVADQLDLEPESVDDGVQINAGDLERVVLVFELPSDVLNPEIFINDKSMSLDPAIGGGPPLDALPPVPEAPTARRMTLQEVVNGFTLKLGDEGVETPLSYVDAPLPDECYGEQATSRLKRLATERVLVENEGNATYVWSEEEDSTRRLLNFEQIDGGYAALSADATGRFAVWLADAQQSSKDRGGAVWQECTGPHGVERSTAPERSFLKISNGAGGTVDFQVWLEWNPVIVTQPDGGAWAFFGAIAADGPNKDRRMLYASQFDPTQGKWLDANAMPLGVVQLGPSAVVDSKGVVHVVYSAREKDEDGYYSTLLYTHEDGNGGWVEPVAVSLDQLAGHQIAASLAIDKNDTLYVAWQDQRAFSPEALSSPANADIFVSQRPADGLWTLPVLINNHYPTSAASRPHLVVDGDRLVAVWSVYTSALGLEAAARMEWSMRPLADELNWTAPQTLTNGRGDLFGGRLVAMAADPTGGVVLAYGRVATDTFLFVKRLKPDATEWGSDTLIAFGDSGSYPAITVNNLGNVYVSYNVGSDTVVDVGAAAIAYRSVEPGAETIVTQDDPNTQGISAVTTDLTGNPWFIFYGEVPGEEPTIVGVIRNANVPITPVTAS